VSTNVLAGPGYTLSLPPGFTVAESMPAMGVYRVLPPRIHDAPATAARAEA
jgi:hypothetical protein